MNLKRAILLGAGVLAGVLLVLGVAAASRPYTYHGSLIEPAMEAPPISLSDQYGTPFSLSEQSGKINLIFFGYTHCPDVCPLTLSEYKQIKAGLGDQAERVNFVFITVDPERDTPEVLRKHLERFDPSFYGLTGSPEELAEVFRGYGVYAEKQPTEAGYFMDHSGYTYLIDAQGNLRLTYAFGTPQEDIQADVAHLLRTGTEG